MTHAHPDPPEPSPWAVFLRARKDAIDWFHAEGSSDDEIAVALYLDPLQVLMIRMTPRREIR